MIHHACPKCEELQAEIDWLRQAVTDHAPMRDVEKVQHICAPRLQPAEAKLLLVLRAQGEVTSSERLERLMPGEKGERDGDNIFKIYVCRIRKKLGVGAIENVWGKGYRLSQDMTARLDALLSEQVAA